MPIDNLSKITSRSGINTTILLEAGNVNVTGIVTAAGFVGPFTGGGDIAAGIITGTGLKISGISTLTGAVFINRTSALGNAKLSITKEASQEGIGVQLNISSGITTSLTTFNSSGTQIFDLAHDTDSTPDLIFKLKHPSVGFPVERVRIASNGNVGISSNNSTPQALLDIKNVGTSVLPFKAYRNDVGDTPIVHLLAYNNTLGVVDKLVVTSRGRVGVNTDDPQREIHIKPDSSTASAAPAYVRIESHGSDQSAELELYHTRGNGTDKWPSAVASVDGGLALKVANGNNGAPAEKVRITSDGRLGIGSQSPQAKLVVAAASGDTIFELQRSNTNTTGAVGVINFTALDGHSVGSIQARGDGNDEGAHLLFFTTSAAASNDPYNAATEERLRITSGGKVGIGTNPYYKLDVNFNNSDTALSGGSGGNWGGAGLRLENENTTVGSMSLIHFRTGNHADWHVGGKFVASNNSDFVFLQEGVNEKLRIKNDGKVGIGSAIPDEQLDVAGNIKINRATGDPKLIVSGSGHAQLTLTNTTGADHCGVNFGDNDDINAGMIQYTNGSSNDYMVFHTAGSERFRINKDGRVQVGNQTNNSSITAQFAVIADDGEAADLYVGKFQNNEATAGQSYGVDIRAGSNSTDHGFRVKNRANDATQLIVRGDGNIGINTNFTGSQSWRSGKTLEIFGGSGNVTGELHLGANRGDGQQSVGSINFFDNTQDSTHRHIAIIEADKVGSTSNKRGGDILFYTKDDNVAAPTEKVRIKTYGGLKIGPEVNVTGLSGDGSELNSSNFTNGNGGLVLATPAYAEYQYTWSGQDSYVITLTCGSYFHSEFIYVQHQTNGGTDMQNYARGKWANNHTNHTGYMYEFSGQGTNAAVTTTFTVSDQNDNGQLDLKSNFNSGSNSNGFYGGGTESQTSGTGSATGKFVIDETYNGSGLSASTRALIVRVYFGSFNISIDDG